MRTIHTPQSFCRFGIARCDVTPPVGIYHRMWGAATHDRATGVHRPLTATALVFRPQEGSREDMLVLVAVDHCLLWQREMSELLDAVSKNTGDLRDKLLVVFSHTHAAGLMGHERLSMPGGELIPKYLDQLAASISEAILSACQTLAPAIITYGSGRCSLAGHRDYWDESSKQFVCGLNPEGDADDTTTVARITDEAHRIRATIVNYACHPTTLAWDNTLISPDFPGAMREVIERETEAPCVFIQGASGDLGPRHGFVGDPAVADRNGRQLGHAALAALEALPPPGTQFEFTGPVISGATIGTWAHKPIDAKNRRGAAAWQVKQWTVDLEYRPELPTREQAAADQKKWQADELTARARADAQAERDYRAMVERTTRLLNRLDNLPPGDHFPLPVTLARIGNAYWLAVEGEHYQVLQRTLRSRYPNFPIIVATLANGSRPCYLPPAELYGRGIYQESIALMAAGSLERVTQSVAQAIEESIAANGDVPV